MVIKHANKMSLSNNALMFVKQTVVSKTILTLCIVLFYACLLYISNSGWVNKIVEINPTYAYKFYEINHNFKNLRNQYIKVLNVRSFASEAGIHRRHPVLWSFISFSVSVAS